MSDYMDTAFGTPPWLDNSHEEFEKKVDDLTEEIEKDMQSWEVLEDAVIDFISDYTKDYDVELEIRKRILPKVKALYDLKK